MYKQYYHPFVHNYRLLRLLRVSAAVLADLSNRHNKSAGWAL